MAGEAGKRLYESLEVLFNFVEDGMAEAAFDDVLNALIDQGRIARTQDETGRAQDRFVAARSFQDRYRKATSG